MNPENRIHILRTLRDKPNEELSTWLRRAEIQLQFAHAFQKALPAEQTTGWDEALEEAEALLNAYHPSDGLEVLKQVVQSAEGALAPIGTVAKQYRIHCVGHGHIDMNWMWSWPETVAATHDTFASVLSLMDQYPEVTYSQSQTSVYAIMERYYPVMFEKIKQRVKEGRWEVAAVHWVEGDKNISSAESLCRHILYTRNYFQERFGLSPEEVQIDWEPDTFGHANTIPSFHAQGAIKYYYSCRQGGGFDHVRIGDARPRLYFWEAPDGSRVLVNRESTWYNSYVNIGENIALPLADFVKETTLHDWLNVYGFGNHGGGPTRTEIEYYLSLREFPIYPQILFSTSGAYFKAVEAELATGGHQLPIVSHELNFEFTGCYTSQSAIKRGNRFGENYLIEAETLATLATRLCGDAYPKALIREGWINTLFNQFHDILPGSGVRETREHAQALFQEVGAITGSIKRTAGRSLAARVDTASLLPDTPTATEERALLEQNRVNTPFVAGAGIGAGLSGYSVGNGGGKRFLPFVVSNPCAWKRSERVLVTLYDTDLNPGRIVALDENGVAHPTFLLGKGHDWGHDKLIVAFDATDVPALGYRTYLLCEGTVSTAYPTVNLYPNEWVETPFLKFRFDRYQSGVLEVVDKRTGAKISDGALGAWQFVVERPRGMTSWAIGGEVDPPVVLKSTGIHVIGAARNQGTASPSGEGVMGYLVESQLEVPNTNSRVRVRTMIHALEPRIDVQAELDWREIGDEKRGIPGLTISFPVALSNIKSLYETPFGSVERTLFGGEEVPTLRYAHLSGTAKTTEGGETFAGVTLVQDSKYGHAIRGNDLRLRIVRSSFDPDHAPEVAQSVLRYSLYFHDAPATPAELTRLGASWNHPLLLVPANLQSGPAPASQGFAEVENSNVVLSTLKEAENGEGLILRLAELNGIATDAVVNLSPKLTQELSKATLVDIMERPVTGSATLDGSTLRVSIPAHSFVTVRLE